MKNINKLQSESEIDCEFTFKPLLMVHHIDGDRNNANINNLEIVCANHHMMRHMFFNTDIKLWCYDTKSLTPRDKLKEILANMK